MQNKDLLWNCRRGMKELDVAIERFMATKYKSLTIDQKQVFSDLLKTDDGELFAWLIGSYDPEDDGFKAMIKLLRDCVK